MAANTDVMFNEVLSAIERGEKARARDLLSRLLKTDQDNPRYWLWMSAVVDTAKERAYCLKEVLRRDPQNESARQGLILIGAGKVNEAQPPAPFIRRNWQSAMKTGGEDKQAKPRAWWKIPAYIAAGLVLVGLIVVGIFGSRLFPSRSSDEEMAPMPVYPTMTLPPSATPTKGAPTKAITATPTPLWMGLSATYTPTPLYVNTPHPRTEAYRTGMRSFERGEWASVVIYFQQVATAEPGSPDALYYVGEAYRFQEKYKEAIEAYTASLDLDPKFAPAHLGLARALMKNQPNEVKAAEINLRDAIEADPNYGEAYLELAALYLRKGDARSALGTLDKGKSVLQDSPMYYYYNAEVQLMAGNATQAVDSAVRANELDVTMLESYRLLGEVLQEAGDVKGSVKPLETYVTYQTDDAQAWVWLGKGYLEVGNRTGAMDAFNRALSLDKNLPDVYVELGFLSLDGKDGQKALDNFNTALRYEAASFDANLGKGQAQYLLGYNGDAYMQLSRSEGFAKSDADKAQVYYWRAQALEALSAKDPKSAIAAVHDWEALLKLPEESCPQEWLATANEHLQKLYTATPTLKPTVTQTATRTPLPSKTPTPGKKTLQPTATP